MRQNRGVIVDCAVYKHGERCPGELHVEDALEACRESDDSFVWIGLHEPTAAEFDAVSDEFELHPLAVEDAIKAHQRSKLERYGDCLFLVFKTARYDDDSETIEFSEIQRDLLSEVLNVNRTQVSVQQNEDMRRISGWVAIAAVPTLLAGVWGMNFRHMPELDWLYGYPTALALILVSAIVPYLLVRRSGWL